MSEIGIDQKTFVKAVVVGLSVPDYAEFFELLFVLDDFLVFKKSMIAKNVALNNEAMQALLDQGHEFTDADIEQQNLESEKTSLEFALSMSKAHEEEMKKLQQKEEEMILEAIRLSQESFKKESEVAKKVEEVEVHKPAPVIKAEVPKPVPTHTPAPIKEMPISDDKQKESNPILKQLVETRDINKNFKK